MENDKIEKLNKQIESLNAELESVKRELEELKSNKTFNPLKLVQNKKNIKDKEHLIDELSSNIQNAINKKKKEIEKLHIKEELERKRKEKIDSYKAFYAKHKKKIIAGIIALFALSGVKLGVDTYNSTVHDINFFSSEDTILIGEKLNVDYEISPKNLNPTIVLEFDKSFVEQQTDGSYIAVKDGDLNISLIYDNEKYDQKLIHINPIELENFVVSDKDIVLNNYIEINPEFVPAKATYTEHYLTSSDSNIVKVDGDKLYGLTEGTSKITISSKDGKVKNTFNVNVKYVEAKDIEITNIIEEMIVEEKYDLKVKLSPEILSNTDYELMSSNKDIINIENNTIEALNVGKCTITAKYSDELYKEYEINVKYPPVKDVTITNIPKNSLYVNDTHKLGIEYKPEKASDNEFEWISSKESVIKVNSNGLITAVGTGVAEITLRSKNGIEDHTNIRVIEKSTPVTRSSTSSTDSSKTDSNNANTGNSGSGSGSGTTRSSSGSGSSTKMVWLPATGDCYHAINNCGRMNPNKATQVTEEYAIQHGYYACSKCNP